MKKRHKLISMLLVSALAVGSLAACGSEVETNQQGSSSTVNKESEAASQTSESVAQSTEVVDEEPVELTIMANFGELGKVGEQWIAQLEEAVNVKINWQLPAVTSYEDSLQLMLIDSDKPDAVLLPDSWLTSALFREACDEGMFLELTDMVSEYENIMAHTAEISWDALDVLHDGGIWGIPRSTMVRCDGYALKTEWLEAIDYEYQKGSYLTKDEFFDILYKFTYEDPDGNGIKDTYGLQAYTDANGKLITGLEFIYGIGETESWGLYDGEYMALKYSKTMSNFKDYLAFANKCWEAGVMDLDAFSIDATISNQRRDSGAYGAIVQFAGNLKVTTTEEKPWTMTYVPGVVPNEGDSYGFPNFSTGIWYYWGITSECERPDKVLELFDYILSDEQWVNLGAKGLEGVTFDILEDGTYDFSKNEALAKEDRGITPINVMLRRSDGTEFFVSRKYDAALREELEEYIAMAVDNYVQGYDRGYVPEIASDTVFIEYTNYMNDQINKIIVGEEPVDHWDEVLEGWYAAGGEEYVADMQAYIASFE